MMDNNRDSAIVKQIGTVLTPLAPCNAKWNDAPGAGGRNYYTPCTGYDGIAFPENIPGNINYSAMSGSGGYPVLDIQGDVRIGIRNSPVSAINYLRFAIDPALGSQNIDHIYFPVSPNVKRLVINGATVNPVTGGFVRNDVQIGSLVCNSTLYIQGGTQEINFRDATRPSNFAFTVSNTINPYMAHFNKIHPTDATSFMAFCHTPSIGAPTTMCWGAGMLPNKDFNIFNNVLNLEAMHIDATNNKIGIGTTTPNAMLHIRNTNSGNATMITGTTSPDFFKLDREDPNNSKIEMGFCHRTAANQPATVYWGLGMENDKRFYIWNSQLSSTALSVSNTDNNIGIGTTAPATRLHLAHNLSNGTLANPVDNPAVIIQNTVQGSDYNEILFKGTYASFPTSLFSLGTTNFDPGLSSQPSFFIRSHHYQNTNNEVFVVSGDGNVGIGTRYPNSSLEIELDGGNHTALTVTKNQVTKFLVKDDGTTAIGTSAPSAAKLTVEVANDNDQAFAVTKGGNVNFLITGNGYGYARDFKVKLGNLPDYVFTDPNYKLPSLKEQEVYWKEKGHLMGVPSAKEVAEEGLTLGIMQAAHLEKTEQLYLYIVELEKQMEQLKKEIEILKQK